MRAPYLFSSLFFPATNFNTLLYTPRQLDVGLSAKTCPLLASPSSTARLFCRIVLKCDTKIIARFCITEWRSCRGLDSRVSPWNSNPRFKCWSMKARRTTLSSVTSPSMLRHRRTHRHRFFFKLSATIYWWEEWGSTFRTT